jgi:anti-sigma regulatory factor (Ser/Thr protein kinase)
VTLALNERLPARPDSIAALRHAVVDFAGSSGASDRQREDIALAVSEAVSNAVVHAYAASDSPGDVAVEAWIQDEALEVLVCDEGIGMVPRSDSPGLGLGLPLIHQVAEQIRLEDPAARSGVRLHMTFAIG